MAKKLANPHLRTLESTLSSVYGWALTTTMRATLQEVITSKAQRLGLDEITYCRMAVKSGGELQSVAEGVISRETLFFRDQEQYRALQMLVLPALIERRQNDRKLRLWSVGCSTGEEPFSLAMLVECLITDRENWRVEILAVELSSKSLMEANVGRYPASQLINVEADFRERFFSIPQTGNTNLLELDRKVRRNVKFRHANLYDAQLWQFLPGQFDLIVCSNVLCDMHHTGVQQTLGRVHQALSPHGYFMVSPTEASLVVSSRLKPARALPSGFFLKAE
ncbi:MAG: methyltransferase domain-containing protein [Acidobacteria bacterium]|nr:methyltransferase domain-containing protein [Acidobacteriota bacterium]